MKTKFQTKASRAEEEVLSILKDEKNIRKPWSLVSYQLQNRTLQTTSAEAAIIFNTNASIRPGYEVGEREVFIPNLFVKLSGVDKAFRVFSNSERLKKREKTFVFDAFHEFPSSVIDESLLKGYLAGSVLDKSVLFSEAFKFAFLRREYQEIFISKVNEILQNKQDYFIGQAFGLTDIEIASCLLGMDEKFLYAFQDFDFQFHPPSIIIYNKGREKPDMKQAVTLVMLNLLGFDIIAVSAEGHADMENILNPDTYCVLIGEKVRPTELGKKWRGLPLVPMAALFIAVLIFASLILSGWLNPVKGANLAEQAAVNPAAPGPGRNEKSLLSETIPVSSSPEPSPPSPSAVKTAEPSPAGPAMAKTVESSPPSPAAEKGVESSPPSPAAEKGAELSPTGLYPPKEEVVKTDDLSKKMTFKDPALEKAIREILGKETGDIIIDELDELRNICFVGPNSEGGAGARLALSYSPTAYYDANWIPHKEEGDIKDLSDLAQIPGLLKLEASWQKELDINSLKGLEISQLSLVHDGISDISVLSEMKDLSVLDLGFNSIRDISTLSSLQLTSLVLDGNDVSDLNPIAGMENLYFLNICSNPVEDLSPLNNLTELNSLVMTNVPVKDYSFLGGLTGLEALNLLDGGLVDLSILKDHTRLRMLDITGNPVSDLSPLNNLKSLQSLNISDTNVRDLSVLKELTGLRTLYIYSMTFDDENEAILTGLKNVKIIR